MIQRDISWGIVLLLMSFLGFGQEPTYTGNPDTSFFTARDLAFGGNRSVARDTLNSILTKYPDYIDVRSLLASTFSWDGQYGEARKHFNKITSVERNHKEVWVAAIKNELYAEEYHIALGLANKALLYLKKDTDIELLRNKALENLRKNNRRPNADVVETSKDPLGGQRSTSIQKNTIGITNSFDIFDVVYDPMIYSSISYGRATKVGSIISRINYSNRFQTNGIQYEMDLYPKLSKTFYAYLNYGYSNAPIYPKNRVGAELYANLPHSMEASIGMRYLDFTNSNAAIFTGSLGLYRGNYYFSLRPYVTPQDNGNISFSGGLLMRKYLKDAENYLGVNMGMGYSPELKQLRDGDKLLAETLLYIASQRLHFEYQFSSKDKLHLYKVNLGVTHQELVFDSDNFFWTLSTGFSYHIKF